MSLGNCSIFILRSMMPTDLSSNLMSLYNYAGHHECSFWVLSHVDISKGLFLLG